MAFKNLVLIDANVIIRFLIKDDAEMSEIARTIIIKGAYTIPEVIAEVVYVLKNVYSLSREQVSKEILSVIQLIEAEHKEALIFALNLYSSKALDFVDCLLIGMEKIENANVFSFDKKLNKLL